MKARGGIGPSARLAIRVSALAGAALALGVWAQETDGVDGRLAPAPDDVAIRSDRAWTTLLLDAALAGERVVAVGTRGHVVLSDDAGGSWRQAEFVPTRTTLTGVSFADERSGWAVGHDAVVLHSRDGGETWEVQHEGPELESPLLSIWMQDALRGVAVGAFGLVLRTEDGGGRWQRGSIVENADPHLNDIFPAPDGALYIAAEAGEVFRSDDSGRTWQPLETPYAGSFWGGLALRDGALLVFGMRGHVLRSEDRGASWVGVESGTDQSLAAGVELAGGSAVLGGLGGSLLRSLDGGRSFRAEARPDRSGIAALLPAGPNLLLFGEFGADSMRDHVAFAPEEDARLD